MLWINSIYIAAPNLSNMRCGAAYWKTSGHHQECEDELLLFIIVKASTAVALFSKIFDAIETNILTDIDTDKKIITRHISRKYEVLIYLLNEFGQVSLFEFAF